MIALSYGPWMVLGSLYLHTRSVSWGAFAASLVPACFIMALAVVNAIPDFHQDRLVGKRNLVVRLGRERAVRLYLALAAAGLAIVVAGVVAGTFPAGVPRRARSRCPSSWRARARALRHHSSPRAVPARDALDGVRLPRGDRRLHARRSCSQALAVSAHRIDALRAPLLVTWQLTRDCDLACLHCCTDSAPGKRLADELTREEALRLAADIVASDVPYVMLCGGEPLVVAALLRGGRGAGRGRRAPQDRDQRPALRRGAGAAPRRACRSARSR